MLKWAGGKRWLVPRLTAVWNQHAHRRLVEPFVGGMAVSLSLQPQDALLSDNNPHLINFYTWVQRGLTVEIDPRNDSQYYYACRARFNALILAGGHQTAEAAQLFYYLNRTTYNGLTRFNSKGTFNAPFGQYRTIHYATDFLDYVPVLANWTFQQADFAELQLEAGDFIYADPPYDVEFTMYSAGGFAWHDQERLVEWLARHPGPVVLSNQATARILALYEAAGFTIELLDAPRRIACNGDRTPAREVLASRNI